MVRLGDTMKYNSTTKTMEFILKNELQQQKLIAKHNSKLRRNYKPALNKYRKVCNKANYQYYKLLAYIGTGTAILQTIIIIQLLQGRI